MRDHAIFGPGFHLGVHTLNGAWMATSLSRVLATTGAGFIGRRVAAALLDVPAHRTLGYQPTHDLVSGLATVRPDFDPATEQR